MIKHYLHTNRAEIVKKSLLNCHIAGLHSIMLLDCPGKTIRIYITDPDHQLNTANGIALHPHHCSLTLDVVYGELGNSIFKIDNDNAFGGVEYNRFIYESHINTGQMGFKLDGSDYLRVQKYKRLRTGDSCFMKASEIHTVSCPVNTSNAWIVYEGKNNPNYKPYAWSNKDLTKESSEGLYLKPNFYDIERLLWSVNLI